MNATAKFYTGLVLALTIVVAVSFAIGYRAGFSHAVRAQMPGVRRHAPAPATLSP